MNKLGLDEEAPWKNSHTSIQCFSIIHDLKCSKKDEEKAK